MYRSEILLYNLSLIYFNLYRENELTEKVWYFKVYSSLDNSQLIRNDTNKSSQVESSNAT